MRHPLDRIEDVIVEVLVFTVRFIAVLLAPFTLTVLGVKRLLGYA